MKWEELPLYMYIQVADVLTGDFYTDDVERLMAITGIVTGRNVYEETYAVMKSLMGEVSFLNDPMPSEPVRTEYVLNGTTYRLSTDIAGIKTSQYIDFMNYAQADTTVGGYHNILSVFLIPEGHEYNDGYDMTKVKDDIITYMPVTSAMAVAGFFLAYLREFLTSSLLFSRRTRRTMRRIRRRLAHGGSSRS